MPEIDGNKKVTLEELKLVHDLKLNKDFSGMTALPQNPANSDLLAIQNGSTTYKVPVSAISPSPLVVAITSGQWSGSGSDYYISVNASNVTADSILVPSYDSTSALNLKGPVWCVPAAGSFTIHTSAVPSGTVNVLVQFPGVMGEANYQVLADVYSKSQTYSKTEAVAKSDIINNLTSTSTTAPLSANMGKALNAAIEQSTAITDLTGTVTGVLNSDNGGLGTDINGAIKLIRPALANDLDNFYTGQPNVSIRLIPSGVYQGNVVGPAGETGAPSWFVISYKYSASSGSQWGYYPSGSYKGIYVRVNNNGWGEWSKFV